MTEALRSAPPDRLRTVWKETRSLAPELYREFNRDKVTTQAAAVAYHTIFALPALVILIVMAAAAVNQVTDINVTSSLQRLINDHAPASTRVLLNDQVDSAIANVSSGGLSIGILVTTLIAIWSGANAIGSLIVAFNQAYGVDETRSFVRRKLTTIGLTLSLTISINLAFALLVFGKRIGSWMADRIDAGRLFDFVWNIGRWPVAIIAIAVFLSLLYYLGPNVEQSFRWISPGSACATLFWLIATGGFGLYLRFSNPGSAYGVVGSVLVLLFYLYVTAIIFILGAELNALLAKRHDPKAVANMQRTGAPTATNTATSTA